MKTPNCEWCSLEVSHSTVRQDIRSQYLCPKNTSLVMTLITFVLHCHLSLRLPTCKMVSLCKTQKCALVVWTDKKPLPRRSMESIRWPRVCRWCGCPRTGGAGLGTSGDDTRVVGTHKHSSSWVPPAAACSGGRRRRSPAADRRPAGGVRVRLLRAEACGWLLIPVNPKALR